MKKSAHLLLSLLLATIFFSAFCTIHAAAEDFIDDPYVDNDDDYGDTDEPQDDPWPTDYEPDPVETYDPYETVAPEYPEEPETEYVAPVTEDVEPDTEEYQPEHDNEPVQEQLATEYIALIDSAEPTGFIAPAMDKSVSNKTYSTDYTAGIVSWICVGVGIVVVTAVLVSTKASGRKAM